MAARPKLKTRALTVRKLPEDHYNWLRGQAVAHGRSMEAEMRAIVAQAKLGSSAWPAKPQSQTLATLRGFAEPASPKKTARKKKGEPKPVLKLSSHEAIARLQEFAAKATKNRKSKKLLSEEFLEERLAMWGEE